MVQWFTRALSTKWSKSYDEVMAGFKVDCPLSNNLMCAGVKCEVEKWDRHGRWGGAHLN